MRARRFGWAVAIVAAAGVMTGCSSGKTAAPPPCQPAHAPTYPSTGAALADTDAGGVWCVTVGKTLTVTLHVPPGDTGPPWQPAAASDTSVLAVGKGPGTLPPRATATFFLVRKPGVVTITAKRATTTLWKATVVAVRAK